MKVLVNLGAAGAALSLAACAVGPNYHPPKTAAPANWSKAQLGGGWEDLRLADARTQ
jgi:hypothetical protein